MLMSIHKFAQLSTHILHYNRMNNIKIDEGERDRASKKMKSNGKKIKLIICLCVHSIQIKYIIYSHLIFIY